MVLLSSRRAASSKLRMEAKGLPEWSDSTPFQSDRSAPGGILPSRPSARSKWPRAIATRIPSRAAFEVGGSDNVAEKLTDASKGEQPESARTDREFTRRIAAKIPSNATWVLGWCIRRSVTGPSREGDCYSLFETTHIRSLNDLATSTSRHFSVFKHVARQGYKVKFEELTCCNSDSGGGIRVPLEITGENLSEGGPRGIGGARRLQQCDEDSEAGHRFAPT